MNNYNLGNLISKLVNYQRLQAKANSAPQIQPQAQSQTNAPLVNTASYAPAQMGNLTSGDTSAYVKDLMKLPKNLNELVYIIQRNITQAQFNQQFMSSLNKNFLNPAQAQMLAQLQNMSADEAQNMLKMMNSNAVSQLQATIKNLPISASGMINLSEISALIQSNGKDAITKLITTMANAAKMGVTDLTQLKETAKLINASVATAAQNDNAQTMKLLLLLYLPWLPLQEGTGFDLEIEAGSQHNDSDSVLIITITTVNYGTIKAVLILESSNSVHINIECAKNFPKDELLLRIEGEEKHYSVQSVVSFETSNKSNQSSEKPQAKINMSNTNEINPYLLLMAHSIIRHTLEIDRNKTDGIVSHIDE